MPGEFFEVSLEGWQEVQANLADLHRDLTSPEVPSMKCALFMQGRVIRAFDEGGLMEPWEPLSMFSRFVRMHRASKRNDDPQVMSDTGQLKNSFIPFVDEGGAVSGVGTILDYAPLMQNGGPGEGGDIEIGGFTRRAPGRSIGLVSGKKTGDVRVSPYTMHVQAGHYIPARPFFPRDGADIDQLGWVDIFADIFGTWISEGRA